MDKALREAALKYAIDVVNYGDKPKPKQIVDMAAMFYDFLIGKETDAAAAA